MSYWENFTGIFVDRVKQYRRLNKEEQAIELNHVYLYKQILQIARASDNPQILAYFDLIKIKESLNREIGRESFISEWASHAKISTQELENQKTLGLHEWAKLARVSILYLNRIQKQALASKKTLLLHNLYLVISIASRYQNKGLDLLELIHEGAIGLNRGIEEFSSNGNLHFSNFIQLCIEQEVVKSISNYCESIGQKSSLIHLIFIIKQIRDKILEEKYPSIEQIASELSTTRKKSLLAFMQ
jgi:DNA-directed RNA polymerase sigma subunit (sigma70/sigma32)